MYICIESPSTDLATTVTASSRQSITSHSSHRLSGGSRVGIDGVANLPPPFVGLAVKAQGLEAALCSFPVFN